MTVTDVSTGELKVEKKFYKADFQEVWDSPEYSPYVNLVFNKAYADIMGRETDFSIDHESFEEIRQVAMTLDESMGDLDV